MRLNSWRRKEKVLNKFQTYRPQVEMLEDRVVPTLAFGNLQMINPNLTAPLNLSGLVTGDFNGDGRLDVVSASANSSQLSLAPGLGNGSFGTPIVTNLPAGTAPTFLAAGNFNGDGFTDVAVATAAGNLALFFGSASGQFQAGPVISTGGPISALAAGILHGGSLTDLVTTNPVANTVTVFLNNGGTFTPQAPVALPFTTNPTVVRLGDLNFDGSPDAVVGSSGSNSLTVLLNNKAGILTPTTTPLMLPAGGAVGDIAIRDFTNSPAPAVSITGSNGLPFVPLAVSDLANGAVDLYSGGATNGIISLSLQQTVTGVPNGVQLIAGDFNNDSFTDLAVATGGANTVLVLTNNQLAGLNAPVPVLSQASNLNLLAAADFNNDGRIDLAVGSSNGANPAILVGQNQSTIGTSGSIGFFATATDRGVQSLVNIYNAQGQFLYSFNPFAGVSFTGGIRVAVGNVTGDAIPDLIVGSGPGGVTVVKVYNGASILAGTPVETIEFNPFGTSFGGGVFLATGNLTGPGHADIVCGADAGAGPEVSVWAVSTQIGIAKGTFAFMIGNPLFVYPLGSFTGGIRVACADVNGDGLDDIITGAGPGGGPQVKIYLGNVQSIFNPNPFASFFGIFPTSFMGGIFVAAGDFNGDFKAEVIVSADTGGGPQVQVFSGASIVATPNGTPTSGGFNALIATGFTGGTRVGSSVGLYQGVSRRVLLSTAGPAGNQLTVFDVFAFLANPVGQPPQFIGVFTPPTNAGFGQYVG
jgi:hypothetical protein